MLLTSAYVPHSLPDRPEETNVHPGQRRRSAMTGDPAPGTPPTRAPGKRPSTSRGCAVIRPSRRRRPASIRRPCAVARRRPGRDQKPRARAAFAARVSLLRGHGQGRAAREGVRLDEGNRAPGHRRHVHAEDPSAAQDDLAGFMAAFETLGFHDISLVIKFGVQFGLWGGSVLRLGTDYHHQKYLPATATRRSARLLRHDRDRPRLQRARHRDDRRLRPGDGRVRPALADVHFRQELHRQRGRPRQNRHGVRATANARRTPRRPRVRRAHPRRRGPPAARRAPGGQRREARPQRRGQRPHLVRPRPRAARGDAGSFRAGRGGRQLHVEHQEPGGAVFHDAGHAGRRAHQRRAQRTVHRQERPRHRRALRRAAAAVRPGGGSAGNDPARLPRAPAPADAAAGQRLRAGLRVQAISRRPR